MNAATSEIVITPDYTERVYAGVLGKIIGVYLGRPFEQWKNDRIERELGEINYYVHDRLGVPLVVTDDDITGTFNFLRALTENGDPSQLTAARIGDWWLNTIIKDKTILWWGGMGMSTEHTAYLRLKAGLKAPHSGSIETNGAVVAEQIGAQIFIDGWGLVCPGDAEKAAHLARLAGSVSHDGEAIYGAQIVAAMVAQAFVERDLNKMLDTAVTFVPKSSTIYRLIADAREWAAGSGDDWRKTLHKIQAKYGYDKFGGACHMVPNHALIILALLHCNDDFARALMIVNTAGWDTDCNSGNVGCILGVKNGLAAIDAGSDWRGPVADRMFLPTADGGRSITDAVRETYAVVNAARALAGQAAAQPKNGARFHFSLPGSVQGFHAEDSPEVRGTVTVGNEGGKLALTLHRLTYGRAARVATETFLTPETLKMTGYALIASPTLYPGQTVTANVDGGTLQGPVQVGLYLRVYDAEGKLNVMRGETAALAAKQRVVLQWKLPDTAGQPIAEIGIEATAEKPVSGTALLDSLTWTGTPRMTLGNAGGNIWQKAWVNAADNFSGDWVTPGRMCRIIQNSGVGLVSQGENSWTDYTVSTEILPHLVERAGLAACVQGLRRYVALMLESGGKIRLIEQKDDDLLVLGEMQTTWEMEKPLHLALTVSNGKYSAKAGNETVTADPGALMPRGAIGLLVEAGHVEFGAILVQPAQHQNREESNLMRSISNHTIV